MDACRKCRFDLPLKVRFCPGCGTENPLASATIAAATRPLEPSPPEPTPNASPPVPAPPVSSPKAKPVSDPSPHPPVPDGNAANPDPPLAATPQTSPAATSGPSSTRDRNPVPVGRWLVVAAVALAVAGWFASPLFGPSDPCQSAGVSNELGQARTALGARDHRNALAKSTLALTTCAQGQRADELRRIQTEAVNGIVAEGRRCLRAMDVACLERVSADLAPVARHPAAQAFNADRERDIGTRTNKDLEAARRCIEVGDIKCADQRLELPLV